MAGMAAPKKAMMRLRPKVNTASSILHSGYKVVFMGKESGAFAAASPKLIPLLDIQMLSREPIEEPVRPPNNAMSIASSMKVNATVRRCIPIARRIPISAVRSSTLIIIVLSTPKAVMKMMILAKIPLISLGRMMIEAKGSRSFQARMDKAAGLPA